MGQQFGAVRQVRFSDYDEAPAATLTPRPLKHGKMFTPPETFLALGPEVAVCHAPACGRGVSPRTPPPAPQHVKIQSGD
jgi:hypothetical protein